MGQPAPASSYTYQRRTPEDSLLRKIVLAEWPDLQREIREATEGRDLPEFIAKAVKKFSACGILFHGFVRVRCPLCRTEQLVAPFVRRSRMRRRKM